MESNKKRILAAIGDPTSATTRRPTQKSLDPGNFAQIRRARRVVRQSRQIWGVSRKSAGTLRRFAHGDTNPDALVTMAPTATVKNDGSGTRPARQIILRQTIPRSAAAGGARASVTMVTVTRRGRKIKHSARDHHQAALRPTTAQTGRRQTTSTDATSCATAPHARPHAREIERAI